jgi:hypothetical protein
LQAASINSQAPGEILFSLALIQRNLVERPQAFRELSSKLSIFIRSLHKVLD